MEEESFGRLAPIIFFKTLQDTAPHRNALHHTAPHLTTWADRSREMECMEQETFDRRYIHSHEFT
jgi:hypothetical protein